MGEEQEVIKFIGATVAEAAREQTEILAELTAAQHALGDCSRDVVALGLAAENAGVPMKQMLIWMAKLADLKTLAAHGDGQAADLFRNLGFSAEDMAAEGLPQVYALADRVRDGGPLAQASLRREHVPDAVVQFLGKGGEALETGVASHREETLAVEHQMRVGARIDQSEEAAKNYAMQTLIDMAEYGVGAADSVSGQAREMTARNNRQRSKELEHPGGETAREEKIPGYFAEVARQEEQKAQMAQAVGETVENALAGHFVQVGREAEEQARMTLDAAAFAAELAERLAGIVDEKMRDWMKNLIPQRTDGGLPQVRGRLHTLKDSRYPLSKEGPEAYPPSGYGAAAPGEADARSPKDGFTATPDIFEDSARLLRELGNALGRLEEPDPLGNSAAEAGSPALRGSVRGDTYVDQRLTVNQQLPPQADAPTYASMSAATIGDATLEALALQESSGVWG